jgi:Ca-activated chloride channel family protein
MNRTAAIVVIAGLLALTAVLLTGGKQAPPPDPAPAPAPPGAARSGPLSLAAQLSGSHLLQGGSGEVYLDISLRAAQPEREARRQPVNVALVIDRSGSMAGDKLQHARSAARTLVGRLQEGDRLALVTYGSDVTLAVPSTVISAASRARIERAIDEIVDRGGTFLSGGFERARDELLRFWSQGYVNRVILISDGQANEGITTPAQLTAMARAALVRGVHLTTIGVGLDFNETLMTAMAEHGGGHYYFIEDSSSMADIFTRELKTLVTTVARRPVLRMTLEPGVELVQLYGYTYTQKDRQVTINLPDVYGGQQRKLVCKLRVPAGARGKLPVARVVLAFEDAESGRATELTAGAGVVITPDRAEVTSGQNAEVLARAEEVNIAWSVNRAMDAYSSGDQDGARKLLRSQISATTRANVDLKSPKLDQELSRMRQQLEGTAAAPSSVRGKSLVKSGRYGAYKLGK